MQKPSISIMPRLVDLKTGAFFCGVGKRTLEDWIAAGLLIPVAMPGSTLRDKQGNIIASAGKRRICKILLDVRDLEALIDERKAGSQ